MLGVCRLCKQRRELRRSHIIPEFMFRPLYDERSRALELDGASGRRRTLQKGLYEHLLCDSCEGILQREERYFSVLWFQRDPLPDPVQDLYVERRAFDFERFFRFHLSVLWRASVAQSSQFAAVSLGPFEERFRRFLCGEVEDLDVEPSIFGFVLRRPKTHELWQRIVLAPVRSRPSGRVTYTFVFGGCAWKYCVSSSGSAFPTSLQLKRPGSIILPVIDYTKEGSIARAWEKWRTSQRT